MTWKLPDIDPWTSAGFTAIGLLVGLLLKHWLDSTSRNLQIENTRLGIQKSTSELQEKESAKFEAAIRPFRDLSETRQAEIDRLKSQLVAYTQLIFRDGVYWRELEDQVDGPFCPGCYDGQQKVIRLQDLDNGYYSCTMPTCPLTFKNKSPKGENDRDRQKEILSRINKPNDRY